MLRRVLVALALCATACAHPEIDDALARLNAAIAAAPTDAKLYFERGDLYARHEDWVMAEANLLRAAELAPRLPGLATALGYVELATGRAADARAHLDAALQEAPRDPDALVLRARAHAALKARAAAIADFDAALAVAPAPSPDLFLERAALLPPAETVRSLDAAIARIGPAIALHLRALELEESLGRIDDAVARVDTLARQSERREPWLKRRGDILARAGRADEARAAYTAALDAIAALPDWLRAAPDTRRLSAELIQLSGARS